MGGTGTSIFNFYKVNIKKKFFVVSKNLKLPKKMCLLPEILIIKYLRKKIYYQLYPLGSNLKKSYLKLSPIPKTYFKRINKKSLIFDVIYDPKQTLLGKLARSNNIKFLNGLKMNTPS